MNQIYKLVWSNVLGAWIVASEFAKQGKKNSGLRSKALVLPLLLYASSGLALPTGSEVVAGAVDVATPSAGQMQIQQSSQKAIVNWQGFSIGANETVNIQQPNAEAALLNRVVGQDASTIQGQLNANGQVYLVNPNGVLFSKTAQVDVGGLVASTHVINNQDFLNGNQHFTQDGADGSVINQGEIKTTKGGVVALIGEQVENSGSIVTPEGSTVLAAGKTIDLDMQGDGLVEVKVTEAALKAQINNQGIIQADGGQVVMTAQAAGQLLNTVINNDGVIEARGLVEKDGKIVLTGGNVGVVEVGGIVDVSGKAVDNSGANTESVTTKGGSITVSGEQINIQDDARLDASGAVGGGTILIGDKQTTEQITLDAAATVTAQALETGKAGRIDILANMEHGIVKVDGSLDASAPKQGDGGFIETSAAHVKVTNTAKITTKANNGKTGTWLIDPVDYTIAASGGDITGNALSASLNSSDVTIASTAGSSGVDGDVNVNDAVSWSANKLTLNAERNINVNASLTASGTAQLALEFGLALATPTYIPITLPAGPNFSMKIGFNPVTNFMVITSVGTETSTTATDLQGIRKDLSMNYVLGDNINTSATSSWNGGAGFTPLGNSATPFTGRFEGLGHSITGLTINRPDNDQVGLFGATGVGARISNLWSYNVNINGHDDVGGLIGINNATSVYNVHMTGSVNGRSNVGGMIGSNIGNVGIAGRTTDTSVNVTASGSNVGGLIGWNAAASVANAFATNNVTGFDTVGGLVGFNDIISDIIDSYATGNVVGTDNGSGLDSVGGLVGLNHGLISSSHATGNATGTIDVGGLVGFNEGENAIIESSYSTGNVTGLNGVGGLVGNNSGNVIQSHARSIVNGNDQSITTSSGIVIMPSNVGGLVGYNNTTGYIDQTYATGSVTGVWDDAIGGLVGFNFGTVSNSHATGNVSGLLNIGGLVGRHGAGTVSDSYATGNVTGTVIGGTNVGGLVGSAYALIRNSYAIGSVTGENSNIGGLVGYNVGNILGGVYATGTVSGGSSVGGLVGDNHSTISNSYATGNVTGSGFYIGGLVGKHEGNISNAYATNSVTGSGSGFDYVGGLVGFNNGSISYAYATGIVNGTNYNFVGGLVGENFGSISITYSTSTVIGRNLIGGLAGDNVGTIYNAYATGDVTGINDVGGLAGYNEGNISNTYATGAVAGNSAAGGLVGYNTAGGDGFDPGLIIDSFWDTQSSGQSTGVGLGDSSGAIGKTTAEMMQMTTFNETGWSISDIGGSSAVWRIYEGYTMPLLRSFMTPLTVTADNISKTYDGQAYTGILANEAWSPAVVNMSHWYQLDTAYDNAIDVGTYLPNHYYSDQQGYDISYVNGILTINPAELTAISLNGTRAYDGTGKLNASIFGLLGLIEGEDLTLTGVGTMVDKNVGVNKPVSLGSLTLGDGFKGLASNYTFSGGTHTVTITPAELTLTSADVTKTYDGTQVANGTPLVVGENSLFGTDSLSGGSFAFTDKNIGTGKTVTVSNVTVNDGNDGTNYAVSYVDNTNSVITPYMVSLIGDRSYDGSSTVNSGIFAMGPLVGSETLNLSGKGFVEDANAAINKPVMDLGSLALGNGSNGGLASNYTLIGGNHTATITPASLIVTANADSKTYDGLAYAGGNGVTYSGLVNEESPSVLAGNLIYSGDSQGAINVGSYSISPAGLSSNNYAISFVDGLLNIDPAGLVVNLHGSRPYDGTVDLNASIFSLSGLIEGENLTLTGIGTMADKNVGVNKPVALGSLALADGSVGSAENYTLVTGTHTVTITPATLNISTSDVTKVYDGTLTADGSAIAVNGSRLFESDSLSGGDFAFVYPNVGVKKTVTVDNVTVNDGNNGSNYSVSYLYNTNSEIRPEPKPDPTLEPETVTFPSPAEPKNNQDHTAPLENQVIYVTPVSTDQYVPETGKVEVIKSIRDDINEFAGVKPQYCDDLSAVGQSADCQKHMENYRVVLPTLKVKNSAGGVKRLQMSANNQYLSLLLEDGSVRVWDFQQGDQHRITSQKDQPALTDIGPVDNKGELVSIASTDGISTQDVIISTLEKDVAIQQTGINHFITSNDGSLVLASTEVGQLGLWNNKLNKKLWQMPYGRGVVKDLALSDSHRFGAVLSRQPGAYALPTDLKLESLTDAVNIIDLGTGDVFKSLPNLGEQILAIQFIDNDTLQLKLANGELLNWSVASNSPSKAGNFAEPVSMVDSEAKSFAYVNQLGEARIGDGRGQVLLGLENKNNPFKDALLLDGDKKLLTVMANGELALWDVATGKKLLRLFSTKQGWTVMDAYGRFDGSEDAMENFSWSANEEDIPLDSFSENYYEPGLLSSVLRDQDYLNRNPNMVKSGITLPPKVVLQIAEQQPKDDTLALKLDVFDRGGGIDKIHVYQNGKVLNWDSAIVDRQTLKEPSGEHRILTLNITPNAGKNIVKVVASNDMGIESGSSELNFDGETKAYASSLRLLTIGIDQYSDTKLNLEYSVRDATAISEAVSNSANIAVSKAIYNKDATKSKILAELKELSQGVQQDVLVIYFAGHGLALDKEWYFLPHEAQMRPSLEEIAASGITATELSDIFKSSKIQHILLMVDSCYSGASMDAFSKMQNGQRYFTRQLSRSLGITVMTAAAKDQQAYELQSLGHGLFTYLVTQELEGKDAGKPVTAHGMAESIATNLPIFSKKILGSRQEPAIYAKGNDFMLTNLVKKPAKGGGVGSTKPEK